jgi:UDP-N-acetylglucosamine 4,6-dehydratase/5-epimerase
MKNFDRKIVCITGGTGSFGSTFAKKLLASKVNEIRIFSRDEKKQEDLRSLLGDARVKFYIGDVRDYGSVHDAFINADYVFHAAALKQVPSCEFYPIEAVKTNILGAENVIKAAIQNQIKKCVVLSTDKAVYPINAMGMSKALMEKVMIANARMCNPKKTILCATRYGNVMASRGSVIPLFMKQVLSGNDVTITNPNMTRFLMSLDESVNLVVYAFKHAKPGDILVQKSPGATVNDIAHAIFSILKMKAKIKTIGTRHGEKLFESLVSAEEMLRTEDLGSYYRIPSDMRDLNYTQFLSKGEKDIDSVQEYTSHNTTRLNLDGVIKTLQKLDLFKNEEN